MDIQKKKIIWANTYYYETREGEMEKNGERYIKFRQEWENGNSDVLYLREKDGTILQFEKCCDTESLRYDHRFKKKHSWTSLTNPIVYQVRSYKGKLKTPFCEYKDLMVIEAKFPDISYLFYYKKGYGYVGAKLGKKLISYVSPDWKE